MKYSVEELINQCQSCISSNFSFLLSQTAFLKISCHHIDGFLKLRKRSVGENLFFESIVKWVQFDKKIERHYSVNFDLTNMNKSFVKSKIANSPLVLNNLECMQAVMGIFRLPDDEAFTSFVMVGGEISSSYVRKYIAITSSWQNLPEMSRECLNIGLAYVNNILYVIGGRRKLSLNSYDDGYALDFNRTHFQWDRKSSMWQKRYNFDCIAVGDEIYVAGGKAHKTHWLSSVECYNVKNDRWSLKASMNYKRAGCCLVEFQKILYVLGGPCNTRDILSSVEMLEDGRWSFCSSMIEKRTDFAAVVLYDDIYAIGGKSRHYSNIPINSVEIFDGDTWNFAGNLSIERFAHSACILQKEIYVVGGVGNGYEVKTMEMYDGPNDHWTKLDDVDGDSKEAKAVAVLSNDETDDETEDSTFDLWYLWHLTELNEEVV